ncbi:MAG: peptide deformylase [Pirellulaceae bacterium]|jgi:peptide deformylase|nr:peptide deformylase [Pirellulaceae bacterium]
MDRKPLQVVYYPHPTLRHKSKPIKRVDADLQRIIREMFALMYASNGIGLAANQVDLPLRLFVVNLAASPNEGEELVFLNPVLSQPKGNEESEEGCLSLPQLYGPVRRPKQITVHAYNLRGEEIRATLDGMLSRVVQHELDHLDGVLFTDRMKATALAEAQPVLDEFEREFNYRRERGEVPSDAQIAQQLQRWEEKYC